MVNIGFREPDDIFSAPIVALKFYDPQNQKIDEALVDKYVDILRKEQTLDKTSLPKTENQK